MKHSGKKCVWILKVIIWTLIITLSLSKTVKQKSGSMSKIKDSKVSNSNLVELIKKEYSFVIKAETLFSGFLAYTMYSSLKITRSDYFPYFLLVKNGSAEKYYTGKTYAQNGFASDIFLINAGYDRMNTDHASLFNEKFLLTVLNQKKNKSKLAQYLNYKFFGDFDGDIMLAVRSSKNDKNVDQTFCQEKDCIKKLIKFNVDLYYNGLRSERLILRKYINYLFANGSYLRTPLGLNDGVNVYEKLKLMHPTNSRPVKVANIEAALHRIKLEGIFHTLQLSLRRYKKINMDLKNGVFPGYILSKIIINTFNALSPKYIIEKDNFSLKILELIDNVLGFYYVSVEKYIKSENVQNFQNIKSLYEFYHDLLFVLISYQGKSNNTTLYSHEDFNRISKRNYLTSFSQNFTNLIKNKKIKMKSYLVKGGLDSFIKAFLTIRDLDYKDAKIENEGMTKPAEFSCNNVVVETVPVDVYSFEWIVKNRKFKDIEDKSKCLYLTMGEEDKTYYEMEKVTSRFGYRTNQFETSKIFDRKNMSKIHKNIFSQSEYPKPFKTSVIITGITSTRQTIDVENYDLEGHHPRSVISRLKHILENKALGKAYLIIDISMESHEREKDPAYLYLDNNYILRALEQEKLIIFLLKSYRKYATLGAQKITAGGLTIIGKGSWYKEVKTYYEGTYNDYYNKVPYNFQYLIYLLDNYYSSELEYVAEITKNADYMTSLIIKSLESTYRMPENAKMLMKNNYFVLEKIDKNNNGNEKNRGENIQNLEISVDLEADEKNDENSNSVGKGRDFAEEYRKKYFSYNLTDNNSEKIIIKKSHGMILDGYYSPNEKDCYLSVPTLLEYKHFPSGSQSFGFINTTEANYSINTSIRKNIGLESPEVLQYIVNSPRKTLPTKTCINSNLLREYRLANQNDFSTDFDNFEDKAYSEKKEKMQKLIETYKQLSKNFTGNFKRKFKFYSRVLRHLRNKLSFGEEFPSLE